MDKKIERSLDENTGITEEFEQLSRECFERIFDMLGKRNFERWIDKRKLAPRIKELVIESMDEDDKREHPHWGGYYTRGTNEIKLRRNSSNTATHEKFHFITDQGDHFTTFMNEGLTEYLKSMSEGNVSGYHENVECVKFLHYLFGDSIVKAYLLGMPNVLDNKICSALTNNNLREQRETRLEIKNFYANLDLYHEYNSAQAKYSQAKNSTEFKYSEKELEEMENEAKKAEHDYFLVKDDLIAFFQKMVIARISEISRNMGFYHNGMLDVELASRTIKEMVTRMPIRYFDNNFLNIGKIKEETARLAAREVILNSHLVAFDEGEIRDEKIDMFVDKIVPNVKYSRTQISVDYSTVSNEELVFDKEKTEMTEKILQAFIGNEELDITTYLERMAIIQEKLKISETQMEYILAKHNIDRLSNTTNPLQINSKIQEVFPVFRAIYKTERQRERDTVSTREVTFREIGKNRYLEVRDNQRFFIEIGEDGSIYEEEIKYGHSTIFRGNERLDINYKSGMEDVEVLNNGKKTRLGVPTSFREIKDLVLSEAILKIVSDRINSNEYMMIQNDAPNPYEIEGIRYTGEVDTRSRKIDLVKFIEDLKGMQNVIPESIRQAEFNDLAYLLLDKVYGTGPIRDENGILRREDEVIDVYFEFRDNFEKMFNPNILEVDKRRYLKRLEETTKELNKIRKERVSESAKTAAIAFETPEAKKKYFKNLEEKNVKAKKEEENNLKKNVSNFKYGSYIEYQEDLEHLEYNLSGVYTTDDIDTRERKVKVSEFADAIKTFLSSVPEDKKTEIFDTIFNQMMTRAYGIGKVNLSNDKQLELATANIRNAITLNVFENKKIDENVLASDLEMLNNFHKELAESNKKHTLIAFKDENTRRMYDVIKGLVKSGASEGEVGTQVRTLIEIHNEMMREKEEQNRSRE